jgi:hypothetical protein
VAQVTSDTPAAAVRELRDGRSFLVSFYTGLGRNGTRLFRLADEAGIPIDLTGKTLKAVLKSSPDAVDTELSGLFPLTATVIIAGAGTFSLAMSLVNLQTPLDSALFIIGDYAGAQPVVLAQMKTSILKAGI